MAAARRDDGDDRPVTVRECDLVHGPLDGRLDAHGTHLEKLDTTATAIQQDLAGLRQDFAALSARLSVGWLLIGPLVAGLAAAGGTALIGLIKG